MKKTAIALLALFTLWPLSACQKKPQSNAQTSSELPQPVASVHDLMLTIVDPTADSLWDSVGTIVTKAGIEERRPKNDAEWEVLRQKAILLTESANLLALKGRRVVNPGQITSDTGIEGVLGPEGIQKGVDAHFDQFRDKALVFQLASIKTLRAIEKKDPEEFVNVGGQLERACEGCHVAFWYPPSAKRSNKWLRN